MTCRFGRRWKKMVLCMGLEALDLHIALHIRDAQRSDHQLRRECGVGGRLAGWLAGCSRGAEVQRCARATHTHTHTDTHPHSLSAE